MKASNYIFAAALTVLMSVTSVSGQIDLNPPGHKEMKSLYSAINTACYGAFARKDFDKVMSMALHDDVEGMNAMMAEGRIIGLEVGTPVYIVKYEFMGPVQVRIKGTTQEVWVPGEYVSK